MEQFPPGKKVLYGAETEDNKRGGRVENGQRVETATEPASEYLWAGIEAD